MLVNIFDKISFWSLFLVIVLLPVFVLPFTKIPVETSKGLLLVTGLLVSIIFWTMARFFDRKIVFPRSLPLLFGFFVAVAFFLSAFFSASPEASFFGAMFDVGSFWFVFAAFLLMLFSSVILRDHQNAKIVFLGLIASTFLTLLFQALHLFFPQTLSLGLLAGKTDNLLGSWNALGIMAGFSALVSLFLIELFSMPRMFKAALGVLVIFSAALIATVNFPFVWALFGVFALVIFIYKISLFSGKQEGEGHSDFPVFSLFMVLVSLLFFMSGQFFGAYIPNRLGISNIEVRPSFQATTTVARSVLANDPFLGMGPNKFADAWAIHKPAVINSTAFWNTSFDFGSGLLPTFATTTGYVGILSLLLFLLSFVVAGVRSFFSSLKAGTNQEIAAFFMVSLYLFISAFFYGTGPVIILLAFAFAGMFIGLSSSQHHGGEISISFFSDPRKSFFSIFMLILVIIASAALLFKYAERFVSVPYFAKALSAQTVPDAEASIARALSLHSNDLYLRTYAQVQIIKLNTLLSKGSDLSEEEKLTLQASFDQAVNGTLLAIQYNRENYLNFKALGYVYETAGASGVSNAYEQAIEAYKTASSLNPANPGLKLDLARVYFANRNTAEAKEHATLALSLKADYIDALITLSQIAKSEGNNADALAYAEQALLLAPTEENLIKYVNSLKGASSPSLPAEDSPEAE